MSDSSGPRLGTNARDFGLPGRNYGGPGTKHESPEERRQRELEMQRYCRFCEVSFIAVKAGQRFHDPRCSVMYLQGKIHEKTYDRWADGLNHIWRWMRGDEETEYSLKGISDPNYYYQRERDIVKWDFARFQYYLAVKEMRMRAGRSAPAEASRTWKMLADALLELWKLPHDVDLLGWYDPNVDRMPQTLGDIDEDRPLPKARGIEALAIVADAVLQRLKNHFNTPKVAENFTHWMNI